MILSRSSSLRFVNFPIRCFELACPVCRGDVHLDGQTARCRECGQVFNRRDGIWRFLPEARAAEFAAFMREYRAVRASEGWGAPSPDYYRTLPNVGADDPQRHVWRLRARSYHRLLQLVDGPTGLRVLDAGAGNGWLSNRLAQRGHLVAAVDLSDDARDGLGVWPNYEARFTCYQAEFDHLPFRNDQFDLLIFNAALHYSSVLQVTLSEARRVIKPGGRAVVLDSPFYAQTFGGAAMVAERTAEFTRRLGSEPQSRTIGFLTEPDLERAAAGAGWTMRVWAPDANWLKTLRRALIRHRNGREPARMPLVVLEKVGGISRCRPL